MLRMARVAPTREAPRILDLGSGPAPCSIAAADYFGLPGAEIVACDRSSAALDCAERLVAAAGIRLRPVPGWDAAENPVPAGPFDLVVIGHLLNELWADLDDRLDRRHGLLETALSRLEPGGSLLFLEPALLKTGRDAIALRDRLAAAGRRILAPCLRDGPCPALEEAGRTCHSDFAWESPPIVRDLSRRTGLGKDLVKTTAFVVAADPAEGREPLPSGGVEYRVVSDPMTNKAGRVRYLICGGDGRFPFSAKRGEGFPGENVFFSLCRSDRIALSGAIRRETGLALGPETMLSRVAR
jgi:SAM-dependent methyltransferase